jgi:predicted RND superfamily exporter protein
MAGLSSLLVTPIVPIENFAVTGTIGIFFAFFGTLVLLPLFMSFRAPAKETVEKNNPEKISIGKKKLIQVELFFQKLLGIIAGISEKHPKPVILVFLIIMALALSGYPGVKVDTNMAKMIKPGYGVEEAYNLIDNYFGGSASVEIVIDTGKQDGMKELSILRTIEDLGGQITSERDDFVPRRYSLVKAVKESYKALTEGAEKNYRLPESNTLLKQILITYESADPATRKLLVDDEWRYGRLSLQVYNKSSYEYSDFMDEVNSWIDEHFTPLKKEFPGLKVTITGNIPLMMQLLSFISVSQIKSFGLVLAVVSFILLVLYGSLKFGLLALVPNLFPILLVFGVTGWMDIPLDSDTLLVMPIAIGIAVDDTIHFLTHFRTELLNGNGPLKAVKASISEVGQAMIFTSIILSLGFLIFTTSIYTPLTYFGILSAIAIASALLADLFLLPALLILYHSTGKNKMII